MRLPLALILYVILISGVLCKPSEGKKCSLKILGRQNSFAGKITDYLKQLSKKYEEFDVKRIKIELEPRKDGQSDRKPEIDIKFADCNNIKDNKEVPKKRNEINNAKRTKRSDDKKETSDTNENRKPSPKTKSNLDDTKTIETTADRPKVIKAEFNSKLFSTLIERMDKSEKPLLVYHKSDDNDVFNYNRKTGTGKRFAVTHDQKLDNLVKTVRKQRGKPVALYVEKTGKGTSYVFLKK